MTPARYAIALKERTKTFENIPESMIREETCIELVRDSGLDLARVPERWRTEKVCAYALRKSHRAMEYVPESVRAAAQQAVKSLPREEE